LVDFLRSKRISRCYHVHRALENPHTIAITQEIDDENGNKGNYRILANVNQVVVHPNFTAHTFTNDIAILMLKDELRWTKGTEPICIPGSAYVFQSTKGIVAGWGKSTESQTGMIFILL